jgi:hypothetical protein
MRRGWLLIAASKLELRGAAAVLGVLPATPSLFEIVSSSLLYAKRPYGRRMDPRPKKFGPLDRRNRCIFYVMPPLRWLLFR